MKRMVVWTLVGFLVGCGSPPPVPVPQAPAAPATGPVVRYGVMTFVDGEVSVQTGGKWAVADVGLKVDQSAVVKTGPASSCDLQFGRLGTLHLAENTVVALTSVGLGDTKKAVDLEVVSGTLTAKVAKLLGDQRFHVRTDTVVAGVRGTRFLVSRIGARTSVAVAEGLVALVPPADPDAVQQALDSSPSVGPGREGAVSQTGEPPVIGPVGADHQRTLDETASMRILDNLPPEKAPSRPTPGAPATFGAPRLEEPAAGATFNPARTPTVTLRWKPVPGATGYEVTVSSLGSGKARGLLSWTTPGESVSLGLAGQLGPGSYLWEVVAVRSNLNFTEDRSPGASAPFSVTK